MSETVIVQTNAQYEQSYFKAAAVRIIKPLTIDWLYIKYWKRQGNSFRMPAEG